jgi:hypothetical protein
VKRLKKFEAGHVPRAVSDLTLEKMILVEAVKGNF